MEEFRIIILTPDTDLPEEEDIIRSLFTEGLDTLHLRKTAYTERQMKEYLDRLPEEQYRNIVLHSHFGLLKEYPLKGVHLNRRAPRHEAEKPVHRSRSVHSIEELGISAAYDYVFISPVFDSISKPGYQAAIDITALSEAMKNTFPSQQGSVIGLGGVNTMNISILKEIGLQGAALLGYIWADGNKKEIINRFSTIKKKALEQ